MGGMLKLFFFNPCFEYKIIFIDFGVKIGSGKAQKLGGAGPIAAGKGERFADDDFSQVIQAEVKCAVLFFARQDCPHPPADGGLYGLKILGFIRGGGYRNLGEVITAQWGPTVKDQRLLNDIGQFANVAGPGVLSNPCPGLGRHPRVVYFELGGVVGKKVITESGYIILPVA